MMLSSQTLKTFVKMHEYKLNAKMQGIKAGQFESRLDDESHDDVAEHHAGAAQHWAVNETDVHSRRRPKSRYFNFILTGTRQ